MTLSLCGFRWSSAWRFCALRHEDGSGAPAALEPSLRPPSVHYHSLPRGVSFADQAGQLHLAPEHSSKQFVGEGFCCKKVILLIMGYLPFRNLIKFSQVHDEIMIFEDSHVNLSGDEGIFANRICFS